jgi:uncharacterized membrane protein
MTQRSNQLDNVISNGYNFELSSYISRGFHIFGRDSGYFIGYFIVYLAIVIILSIIPLFGQIASSLIGGALLAGFYIVADRISQDEDISFSHFFEGFQSWLPLFVGSLLKGLIAIALFIPLVIYFIAKFGINFKIENPDFGVADGLVFTAFFLVFMYVFLGYIYTPFFIIFDKMDAWAAMEMSRKTVAKNVLPHILFIIAWLFILLLSALPLGLGLFVTVPACYCSMYAAWAEITDYHTEPSDDSDDLLRHLID